MKLKIGPAGVGIEYTRPRSTPSPADRRRHQLMMQVDWYRAARKRDVLLNVATAKEQADLLAQLEAEGAPRNVRAMLTASIERRLNAAESTIAELRGVDGATR